MEKLMFIHNWRQVAARSFSMWLGCYLPLLWLLVPEALFAWWGIELSPALVWVVAFTLATGAALRLIDQGIGR